MKTAKEMRNFAGKYSITGNRLTGVVLENCPFGEIEKALKTDEEVLFCIGALIERAVAFTNNRLIIAETRMISKGQSGGIKFFSYDNINSVSYELRITGASLKVNTIGDEDLQYFNLYKDKITSAISEIDTIINEYRNNKNGQNIQVLQQSSPADEIKKYKELLDSGILTQEEFEIKKKQLLGL